MLQHSDSVATRAAEAGLQKRARRAVFIVADVATLGALVGDLAR
jgi:hypothetical protein